MKRLDILKSFFLTWDIYVSLAVVVVLGFLIKDDISLSIVKEILTVSISVLAIVFSVFFAAMAVLITAGDNEFVRFLEEDGSFKQIAGIFRVTLLLLFIALLISIILFVIIVSFSGEDDVYIFPKWGLLVYSFLALYALLSAINSSLDAIKYAELRARFLAITKKNDKTSEDKK
jgi:hypothetical protein